MLLLLCLGLSASMLNVSADTEREDPTAPTLLLQVPGGSTTVSPLLSSVGRPQTNSCRDVDMSLFAKGQACGPPLSQPCFDFERCASNSVYVYDSECSLLDSSTLLAQDGGQVDPHRMNHHYIEWVLRDEARKAGLLAATYESACMYVHVGFGQEACAVHAPRWNNGSNHLMVDMSDDGR